MSTWLTRIFHKPSTGFPQADILLKVNAQTSEQASLRHEITLLRRDMEDFEERTARKLDRYRKWIQARKDGKFGKADVEVPRGSTNGPLSMAGHDHESIAAEARKRGLIS